MKKLKRLRENEKKQTIIISIAASNYDTEIIIDLIDQAIEDFWVKYQESSIGFENLAYLQSIENKCKLTYHSRQVKLEVLVVKLRIIAFRFHASKLM